MIYRLNSRLLFQMYALLLRSVMYFVILILLQATALHVYRSLIYGNRLLCSTECDTLLSNLGVYGNQYNDPRFAENVNMLIQMFDGTKHQNRSTLSTSYIIPEGRRASIIGASVGDPYARVSQQHYEQATYVKLFFFSQF